MQVNQLADAVGVEVTGFDVRALDARSASVIYRHFVMVHPLVRRNPDTNQRALYLNPIRIECIDGVDRSQSDELLDELTEHCLER